MSNKKNTDEVEELLRAAEDETLLRLSLNSHTARGSSAQIIDPDLDRRFQALKSRPKTSSSIPNNPHKKPAPTASSASGDAKPPKTVADGDGEGADDLFCRFTALKSSLPAYSASARSINDPGRLKLENGEGEDDDDDDEVEKLIKWAVDAARLDPSLPSDTDDDDDDNDDSDEEDEDSDGAKRRTKRK